MCDNVNDYDRQVNKRLSIPFMKASLGVRKQGRAILALDINEDTISSVNKLHSLFESIARIYVRMDELENITFDSEFSLNFNKNLAQKIYLMVGKRA